MKEPFLEKLRRFYRRWVVAYLRLDAQTVCSESDERYDFHDYPDSTTPYPRHFFRHTCRRCGKKFHI